MKKYLIGFCIILLAFSAIACGRKNDVSSIIEDGAEISAKEFLATHLNEYIKSERYLARKKTFEDATGQNAKAFTVTRVIEMQAENLGPNSLSVHFLAVKADCDWAIATDSTCDIFSDILLVVDYETGNVYDEFLIEEDWINQDGTHEQQIASMFRGPLVGLGYNGGTILVDTESRTELSKDTITEINDTLQDA